MCGIAGVVTASPSAAGLRPQLEASAAARRHRGPDDIGITLDGPVGLVHTRLLITDLAGGHQPIVTPDGALSAVVNGEIQNHVELRHEFSARTGVEPPTHSDSECVLQVYAAEGIDGLRHLNGMFALALHDRTRRRVVPARDRLGIQPPDRDQDATRVSLGPELKALLPLLPAPPALDEHAIAQCLGAEFLSGEHTDFAGIRRVPPGHVLAIDADLGVRRERCYWSLQQPRPLELDMEQAQQAFSARFEQVMREPMCADVPFGLFLSGGVDSSLLCAMLTQLHDRPIGSFSIGYTVNRKRNELDDAHRIARRFGRQHHALEITPGDLLARIPHAVWSTDELMRDYAILPTSLLAERAGRSLKAIINGEGGDEAFAGYARYRKRPLQRWLSNLMRPGLGRLQPAQPLARSAAQAHLRAAPAVHDQRLPARGDPGLA